MSSTVDLEELLRLADAAAGEPPPVSADLPMRVLRRAATRRRRTLFVSGVAAAILLTLAILPPRWAVERGTRPTIEPGHEITAAPQATPDWQFELAALRIEADVHLAAARRIAELRRRRNEEQQLRAALALMRDERRRDDPVRLARAARDRAAALLVQRADRVQHEFHQPAPAMSEYREAIRLFPDSPWAAVARERLGKLKREQGESL